jgi:hypothetical protein
MICFETEVEGGVTREGKERNEHRYVDRPT